MLKKVETLEMSFLETDGMLRSQSLSSGANVKYVTVKQNT